MKALITPNHNPKYTILFDHCLFFEYFDFIKVFVFRRKKTDTTPANLGHINPRVFHILLVRTANLLVILLYTYTEIGWNRTNSDFSIDLQSTVIPLDYYLIPTRERRLR